MNLQYSNSRHLASLSYKKPTAAAVGTLETKRLNNRFMYPVYWGSTQDTDRDRYFLKDQRPKIKVSNDLISLSELVSRLVVYNPIILSNP